MRGFGSALTATAALAAFAGVGAAAAPAQAATSCTNKGQRYLCAYGVSTTKFLNGTEEEFVVGADHAVWTNWTHPDGSWNGWVSMGGWVQSRVSVDPEETGRTLIVMSATGRDGNRWFRMRHTNGHWTEWQVSCHVEPNGPNCP